MDDVEIIKKRRKINNIRYRKNVYVPKMKIDCFESNLYKSIKRINGNPLTR